MNRDRSRSKKLTVVRVSLRELTDVRLTDLQLADVHGGRPRQGNPSTATAAC